MIKGSKIGLRALEEQDLALLRDWRNIPDFRRNFREFRELNINHQQEWFQNTVVKSKNDFMFGIVLLEDQQLIGACGLTYLNWIIRSADFSFYIGHKNYYIDNLGLAEEAARLLIKYGFEILNLNKLWMELYEFDSRKLEFFKKFNFKVEGTLRENCFEDNRYYDSHILSLLRREYGERTSL